MNARGILLLYYLPVAQTAGTIVEHIDSFSKFSEFTVYPVNTALGRPSALAALRFEVIVLHYSLFGPPALRGVWPDGLGDDFQRFLVDQSDAFKVAFFQDEYRYCRERFAFLDRCRIDLIYTLLDEKYWHDVYERHTLVRKFAHTLTGYVDPDLVARALTLVKPDAERTVDIGYRARRLDFYMGRGAQEKTFIATEFVRRDETRGLVLDVAVGEDARIYGDAWLQFLANCRGVLGVEAGTSVFDLDGSAEASTAALLRREPSLSFDDVFRRVLQPYDGRIEYRTISPRHFEAAALHVCQVLFEGEYQGILRPDEHYLRLAKDFSNLGDLVSAFRNPAVRRRITDAAYRDVIASDRWSYRKFIADFDRRLRTEGRAPVVNPEETAVVRRLLRKGWLFRNVRGRLAAARYIRFPGRERFASTARRLLRK